MPLDWQSANPPTTVWPTRQRPELIVDCWRVMLVDPQNNVIGFDTDWGTGGTLSRYVYAERAGTRNL